MRIFEAVIAILLITGAILVIYQNRQESIQESEYIDDLQLDILSKIAEDEELRNAVIVYDEGTIREYINNSLPAIFNFSVTICDLNASSCPLGFHSEKEIFVQERIIATTSNFSTYNPKKIRFFIWKKD